MAIDCQARVDLRNTLVCYMAGGIRTFAFDDQNSASYETADRSVQVISRFLYNLHDDFIDHPISVSSHDWETLRRIVAFLGTDHEIQTAQRQPSWPFRDEKEWRSNKSHVNESGLPDYNAAVHGCQVNPWWNRIPSRLGFALLVGLTVAVVTAVCLPG